jgi:hypothetical protein
VSPSDPPFYPHPNPNKHQDAPGEGGHHAQAPRPGKSREKHSSSFITFRIKKYATSSKNIYSNKPTTTTNNQHPQNQLVEASKGEAEGMKGLLSTMAVNQDPEDRRNFLMLVSVEDGYVCGLLDWWLNE